VIESESIIVLIGNGKVLKKKVKKNAKNEFPKKDNLVD
jgi:hypothetical protein